MLRASLADELPDVYHAGDEIYGISLITNDIGVALFCAGRKAIHFTATASVRTFGECAEGSFKYVTGTHAVADKENGGVPTGGNAAVILTYNPDERGLRGAT